MIDGIVRIKPLVKRVEQYQMPAVAITDQSNLFGMVKFYRAAIQAGIKPIIGVDVRIADQDDNPASFTPITLLCQNNQGYKNITRLVSRAYMEGQVAGKPILKRDWLRQATEGLLVLSGGHRGDVGRALLNHNKSLATTCLNFWTSLYGERFYLELTRTGQPQEEDYIHAAIALAIEHDIAVVATNNVRFLEQQDFEAHEARVCINEGYTLDDVRRPKNYTDQQYLRSSEEMIELFSDIPEAIENTLEIAKRCNVELTLGKNFLPDFPIPEGMTMEQFFGQQARVGLEKRLSVLFDTQSPEFKEKRQPYDERLQIELDVINGMGFPGYFLIVADFIQWAKEQDIPVGPGRGSGAGSLVAYALTITDLDPIQYELLFERFLNPERVSMPDFDVDFCMEKRDKVIDYVANHYGREKVSQIITYGSMAAKAVVRDVGRVLAHPYGFVDKIAKMIPFELGITLDKALQQEEALNERYQQEEEVKYLIDLARSLEGITRNAGKHAGGVVIAPSVLTDFAPLYCEEGGGSLVTQFDKDDVEAVGLVKFDFLGLRTLTIIDWALKAVNRQRTQQGETALDISTIPLDDQATFKLLKECKTTAVFQLESRGMKDLIKRLQPDCFEEIIALVALFRPGPLQSGMVDDFINRKHGRQKIEYPHPDIAPILQPTYGVILYQEQVMQIAQILAGYTLGGADMLRRAMGKKKPEEMAKQREFFTQGSVERGVNADTATYIFDLMEKFAGYGFNKSHSAAYALVSYQTAWLKTHYPAPFMAAVLSSDMDNTDKVVMFHEECTQMKLKVLHPNVNRCAYHFTAPDERTVQYGLGAIKGIGEAAIQTIVDARQAQGDYLDFFEFCQRVELKKINRRALETLIRAGAFDGLGPNRASLLASLANALLAAEQHAKNLQTGQNDLFSASETTTTPIKPLANFVTLPEWPDKVRLDGERDSLGLYLTGHPIDAYEKELAEFVSYKISQLKPNKNQTVHVAGLIVGLRLVRTKRGDKMAIVTLDDRSARLDVAVFSEMFNNKQHLLEKDKIIIISGEVSIDEFSGSYKMSAKDIQSIDEARAAFAKRLVIRLTSEQADSTLLRSMADAITPYKAGTCPIFIDYYLAGVNAKLVLGHDWRVHPRDELLASLSRLSGPQSIELEY